MTCRVAVSAQVERAARLVDVLVRDGLLYTIRGRRPLSIAGARLVRGIADAGIGVATVIDVGANAGQFSGAVLRRWPAARVIAFEPLAGPAQRLRHAVVGADAEVHETAVASHDGMLTFFPREYSLVSSALPRSATAPAENRGPTLPPVEVASCRLDTVLRGQTLRRPSLLKLDVQGYELEALRGAEEVLAQIDYLLIEVAFDRTYDGQPLFGEVHRFLEAAGWRLVRPVDSHKVGGRIIEADLLYERDRESVP